MLITKFNRMIRSRVLWGAFAVLISISFVGFLGPRSGCGADQQNRGIEGRLNGDEIPKGEFFAARFFEMGMGQRPPADEQGARRLRERTWQRLAMLNLAEDLGIKATDAEVAAVLQKEPSFAVNGAFNQERYRAIVRSELGVDIPTFENYMRQDLTIRKLMSMLEAICWTTPSEIDERLANLTDLLQVEQVTLPREQYSGDVDVTSADARAYFTNNLARFEIPEQVSVRYVEFPLTNYLAAANLSDEEALDYYNDHIDDFTTIDTNGTSVPLPFDDVRSNILEKIEFEQTLFAARDHATEFVMELAPDRYGNARSFEEAADAYGLTISTTAYFSAYGDVPGLQVGPDFNDAAFALDASDPERYFSDAVAGETAAYVLASHDRRESRIPEFEEVAEQAMELAEQAAAREQFVESARKIRDKVQTVMGSGASFTQAAREFALSVTTTEVFSVYNGLTNEVAYADLLMRSVAALRENELTPVLPVEEGALIACVTSREPGDPLTKQYLKADVLQMLNRYRAGILFEEWREHLLAEADLEDVGALPPPPPEQEDEL